MFMSNPASELVTSLNEIANFSESLKSCVRKHADQKIQKRSPDDLAAMILAYRAIKFMDAYLLVARGGFLEPSAALIRSLYETYLYSRWVLSGNGQMWLDAGKSQMLRVAAGLHKHNFLSPNTPGHSILTDPAAKAKAKADPQVPHWSELAKQTNMEQYHDLFYPHFSNWSHGNFAGSVIDSQVTFLPDFSSMEFPVAVARGLAAQISTLFDEWWTTRTIAPAPHG